MFSKVFGGVCPPSVGRYNVNETGAQGPEASFERGRESRKSWPSDCLVFVCSRVLAERAGIGWWISTRW